MRRIILIFTISAILQGSLLSSGGLSITRETKLYFFNPDSALSNLGHLKLEMEKLFDRNGYPVNFQAFTYQTDFDVKINELQPKFLFAPEWYIKKHGRKLRLKPFLVPVYKGATTYRKVLLVVKNSRISLDFIETHSLAMTSVGPDIRAFLYQALFPTQCKKKCPFRTVIVPKSTDALFALFLGHVDLALVVQDHLENLEKMLPRITGGVRPLVLSSPIPMPMLCYSEELVTQAEVERCKAVFLGTENKELRNHISLLLKIDEWQETSK